jgi:hypothetical protein
VVKDAGYRPMLYNLVPLPYKAATVETTSSNVPVNDDLYAFTSVFGFHLDVMKTEHDALLRMNNIEQCTDRQLSLIAQQMGIDDRLPALPELRRTFVRDANSIQRSSGSASALAELMQDLTGWQTTATISYNLMPTSDSSTFGSTLAQPWNANAFYKAGQSSSITYDVVTYNNTLYAAAAGTSVVATYLMPVGNIAATGATVSFIRDPSAGRNKGYVGFNPSSTGSSLIFTVTPNPSLAAGNFNLYVKFRRDPGAGQVSVSVNGTTVSGWTHDLYAPSRQADGIVYIASGNYGTNTTVSFNVTGKNPLSSGYAVYVEELWFQTGSSIGPQNIGVPPTGASNSSTFWTTTIGGNELPDIDTERNWLTDGQNIWNLIDANGNTNARPDNAQGGSNPTSSFGVIPYGSYVGTNAPGIGNSLSYQNNGTAGKMTLQTCGYVQYAGWSATTPYMAGQPASWGLPATVPTLVYVAKNYTLGDQPDQNPTKWEPHQFTGTISGGTDPLLLPNQAVVMPQIPLWVASNSYAKGTVIRWRQTLYQAAQQVPVGAAPSGYNADTPFWRWMGPAEQIYTFSAYHYRTSTATGVNVRPGLDWYDANGNFLGHAGSTDGKTQVWDGFNDYSASWPSSTVAAPPTGWTTPAAWHMGTGIPWVTTYGTWAPVDDMAAPTAWVSGVTTLQQQAGRMLWFDRTWLYSGTLVDTVYATFRSAPFDPSNTMEHGIVVRYNSANGYWLASRDRLSYTTLTYTSGNLTGVTNSVQATWTPITDGTRMKVTVNSGQVMVYAMTGAQPGTWVQLANVSSTQFNTQTGVGLLERIRL